MERENTFFLRGNLFEVNYEAFLDDTYGYIEIERGQTDPFVFKLRRDRFYDDADELIVKGTLAYIECLDEVAQYME